MGQRKDRKEIRLTDNHILTYDKYQFVLQTRDAIKGDKILSGKYKGQTVKEDSYKDTYFPNLKILCKHVLLDEFKEAFELYDVKYLGEKFEEILGDEHITRLDIATKWFETIKNW